MGFRIQTVELSTYSKTIKILVILFYLLATPWALESKDYYTQRAHVGEYVFTQDLIDLMETKSVYSPKEEELRNINNFIKKSLSNKT